MSHPICDGWRLQETICRDEDRGGRSAVVNETLTVRRALAALDDASGLHGAGPSVWAQAGSPIDTRPSPLLDAAEPSHVTHFH